MLFVSMYSKHVRPSAVARPNGQPRQAGVGSGVQGHQTFFPVYKV